MEINGKTSKVVEEIGKLIHDWSEATVEVNGVEYVIFEDLFYPFWYVTKNGITVDEIALLSECEIIGIHESMKKLILK